MQVNTLVDVILDKRVTSESPRAFWLFSRNFKLLPITLLNRDNYYTIIMATSLTGIFNKRGLDISMTKEELYVYILLQLCRISNI